MAAYRPPHPRPASQGPGFGLGRALLVSTPPWVSSTNRHGSALHGITAALRDRDGCRGARHRPRPVLPRQVGAGRQRAHGAIARYIREGAMAFLVREYKVLAIYAVVVSALLFFGFNGKGLGLHAAARVPGGRVPVAARRLLRHEGRHLRATCAPPKPRARTGKAAALVMALDGGAVMGLCVAGLGLIGLGGHPTQHRSATPRAHTLRHRHPRVRGGRFLDRALRAHRRRHLHQGRRRRRRHRRQGRSEHPRGRPP